MIKGTIGIYEVPLRDMQLGGGRSVIVPLNSTPSISNRSGLTKAAEVTDTIRITVTKYKEQSLAITSINQELNISYIQVISK